MYRLSCLEQFAQICRNKMEKLSILIAIQESPYIASTLFFSYHCVSSFISIAVIKDFKEKQLWGTEGLFAFHLQVTVHHQQQSRQELKQEFEAKPERNTAC